MAAGDPKPTPGWIDLRAMLTEELECIQQGEVSPGFQERSEGESLERAETAKRAKIDAARSVEFFRKQFGAGLWGLGLSGGGIRSATFALGLIQGMAKAGLLPRFHYLSTVSGGGYIGSWLSSWATRHPGGIDGVVDDLNAWAEGKKIEADPIWYLRSYSSYVNPRHGVLSADTWTVVATYLRNLLLNWLVLVPLFWVVVLSLKIYLALVRLLPEDWITGFLLEHRRSAAVAAGAIGSLCLIYGVAYIFSALVQKQSGETAAAAEAQRAAKMNTQSNFLLHCLFPVMLASLLLPLAWAWYPDYANAATPRTWLLWAVIAGIDLRLVAWGASFGVAQWRGRVDHMQRGALLHIAAASLVTGALGGVLSWWILTTLFPGIAATVGEPSAASSDGALELPIYVCFAPPLLLVAMLANEAVFIGLVSRSAAIDDEDREWWGRVGGWLLIASLSWVGLGIPAVFGPLTIHWLESQAPVLVPALGGVSGVVAVVLGFHDRFEALGKMVPKSGGILRGSMATLSAAIFVGALAVTGNWLLDYVASAGDSGLHCTDTEFADWWTNCGKAAAMLQRSSELVPVLTTIVALLAFACVAQVFINLNRFSLHAVKRSRLIRAYLGSSNPDRHPNWFTGFDRADNLVMADIKAGRCMPSSAEGKPLRYPFHIVNTALNLVHGENLAWQQRKTASLTISPLHVGNRDLGYRRSRTYGHPNGISLGTALTISGAAASPNMGYSSSRIVGLVMRLFNVRLGVWLGNPGLPAGERTSNSEGPRLSAMWLVYEAFGLNDSKRPYVNLTDGGHFENLGLYELVQRRCRLIVVSDASFDPEFEFEDLGNAIRKIRIDLGIEITMDAIDMHPRFAVDDVVEAVEPGRPFATGRIRYPEWNGDETRDGALIYIKPGIYGDEPRDVMNYAATHPDFPHESTADQWFDESQFESYRRLGRHVFQSLMKNAVISNIFTTGCPPPPLPGSAPTRVEGIHRQRPKTWFGRR
jgi:hypothetical protein